MTTPATCSPAWRDRRTVFGPAAAPSQRPHVAAPSRSWRWIFPRGSQYNRTVPSPRPRARVSLLGGVLAAGIIALSPALAAAQAPAGPGAVKPATQPPAKPAPADKNAGKPGGKKIISLDDEFLVEGQLEKPSAFYVLRRSSTDYDWARLGATFTPLVLESAWDPLF